MKSFYLSFYFLLVPIVLISQKSNDIKQSIIAQSHFSEDGKITLSWLPKDGSEYYQIKYRTDLNGAWVLEDSNIIDTFYTIENQQDELVEFLIESLGENYSSTNILVGNEYFKADEQEHMLILAKDSIYTALSSLIEDYRTTLEQEFIKNTLILVDNSMDVMDVKTQILNLHEEEKLDYILILGHVPVPYSGNSAIDGHTNHKGAWVADGFYGEVDGNWTDSSVNNISASREANHNIPGDGKFDQSFFPSEVDIAVGRIDFSDLPKLLESEIELTRRYLERNIAYRTGQFKATQRAIIDNNFNLEEGFAQGAIKTFHTFLEPDSISYGNFSQCTTKDYLFTFGAGSGNYQGAGGVISTDNLINDSIQSIFTTVFGSYFGDWDVSNNLLRASLARGSSLINAWSGRPIWYFHPMAMGETVGHVLLNTQNNNGNYVSQFGKSQSHISLLGDPSLKMYYHSRVQNLTSTDNMLTWEMTEEESDIVGFTLYYAEEDGAWTQIGDRPFSASSLNIADLPISGSVQLMVRPVGLIKSRSGSYLNEGNGSTIDLIVSSTKDQVSEKSIFPNPAIDYINLTGIEINRNILIFDAQGKVVMSSTGEFLIPVAHLPSGFYYLKHQQDIFKFVKK